jgi:hypothetical protein
MTTTQHLRTLGVLLTVAGGKLKYSAPKGVLTPGIVDDIRRNKAEIINEISASLDHWISRVNSAKTFDDVLAIVGQEFRPMQWTDQQRAQMSKVYNRQIERLRSAKYDDHDDHDDLRF